MIVFVIENQLKQEIERVENIKEYYEALILKKEKEDNELHIQKDKNIQELKKKLELMNKKIENIDLLEKQIADQEEKVTGLTKKLQDITDECESLMKKKHF